MRNWTFAANNKEIILQLNKYQYTLRRKERMDGGEELAKEEKKLHGDCDDEAEDPGGFIHDSFTDPDWRRPKRDNILPSSSFR